MTMFEKCNGSPNSKYDNFARLCSHLNKTRLFLWRRTYQIRKHYCMCSDEATDKTLLFLLNQLALTCVESKCFMGRQWNEVYGMSTGVKAPPAVSVATMMWWEGGILLHSLQSAPISLRSRQMSVQHPKRSRSLSACSFSNFQIKFSTAWLKGDTEFGNFRIKSSQTSFNEWVS